MDDGYSLNKEVKLTYKCDCDLIEICAFSHVMLTQLLYLFYQEQMNYYLQPWKKFGESFGVVFSSPVGMVLFIVVLVTAVYFKSYITFLCISALLLTVPKRMRLLWKQLWTKLSVILSRRRSIPPPPLQQSKFVQLTQMSKVNSMRGLFNIGASCYMNAAIQCLHKTFQLTKALNKDTKQSAIFVKAYLELMEKLSSDTRTPCNPTNLKRLIEIYNNQFYGSRQQDSSQLLMTILNYISEEMQEVNVKRFPQINVSINDDQLLLKAFIEKDHQRSKSIIDNIFIGRFLTIYECQVCKNKEKLFEKFHLMHLPIPRKKEISLEDCMRSFCKPDTLKDENAWWCSKCGTDTETLKSMSVYQANQIIMICLKRFNEWGEKVNDYVHFEKEITLKNISSNPQVRGYTYQLYGVINHSGHSLNYGHYYSYCHDGKTWKEYNDSSVRDHPTLMTSNAFVLFYRKKQK